MIRPRCGGCHNEIDPDCCHCGDAVQDHRGMSHNHGAVPMGCTCGYITPPPRPMVLADIASPWIWAYTGHVLADGLVFIDPYGDPPMWKSNSPVWHGI